MVAEAAVGGDDVAAGGGAAATWAYALGAEGGTPAELVEGTAGRDAAAGGGAAAVVAGSAMEGLVFLAGPFPFFLPRPFPPAGGAPPEAEGARDVAAAEGTPSVAAADASAGVVAGGPAAAVEVETGRRLGGAGEGGGTDVVPGIPPAAPPAMLNGEGGQTPEKGGGGEEQVTHSSLLGCGQGGGCQQ